MNVNTKDHRLFVEGCSTSDLAKKYGTPLYILSENEILDRFNELKNSFITPYKKVRVAYAAKAFFTLAMAKLVEEAGMCVDVVSGGELYTAMKADFPPERIEFNGNNKLRDELETAIDYGIGRIIVDGMNELGVIESICKQKHKKARILYRVTPGVRSSSHDYIVTGKKDSKFGLPLEDSIIFPAIQSAIESEYVDFLGFHFHVGSQLFDNESHMKALKIVLNLVKEVKERFSYDITELNLGGGFGVHYTNEERRPFEYFLNPMMEEIRAFVQELHMDMPEVVIEPGRSIVAEAGLTLYTVGAIKEIPGIRKYVSVDGGMTDNIRPALYQAKYKGIVANKADTPATDCVTVCGKCCESGDILISDIEIAPVESGDLFAVFSTGAYGYSMASNYNKIPIPPVVMVKDGRHRLVVKKQTYEDLIRNEVF